MNASTNTIAKNSIGVKNKKKKKKIFTKENTLLYIMFAPLAIYYIIWAYIPMPGIILAFADYRTG